MNGAGRGAASFARAVEARLEAILRKPVVLSPRDWAILGDWHARGIPLALILETLDEVSAKKSGPAPRSLRYFVRAVEEGWSAVLEGRAIRPGSASDPGPGGPQGPPAAWERALASVDLPQDVRSFLGELGAALRRGTPAPEIDEALDRALASGTLAADLCRAARTAALEALRGYRERMPSAAWDRTLERAVVERVRGMLDLPRLRFRPPMV